MHIVVVYESMFGNTREIAEAIAEGARESQQSAAVRVSTAGIWSRRPICWWSERQPIPGR